MYRGKTTKVSFKVPHQTLCVNNYGTLYTIQLCVCCFSTVRNKLVSGEIGDRQSFIWDLIDLSLVSLCICKNNRMLSYLYALLSFSTMLNSLSLLRTTVAMLSIPDILRFLASVLLEWHHTRRE